MRNRTWFDKDLMGNRTWFDTGFDENQLDLIRL